ncbi:hypothetical protein NCAS_0J02270 [Naumovozyma castellii]|uniref:Nudix hydrolase domain-containing protein n=1 Tax=Naumovozyma castellii TaxID=27288 RepID=G0VL17_NAUCA|nr:hypothetical protein NCAS_0J02270 [Naumovozyma castellii CBS 4309]CCC72206.1 hypothetical protein NCAS_0J02270 [Naumovozyma castellii CBS 4309]
MVKVIKEVGKRQRLERTREDESKSFSFLEVIERVDSLPINYNEFGNFQEKVYHLITHDGRRIGFVLKFVIDEMRFVAEDIMKQMFTVDEKYHGLRFKSSNFDERNKQLDILSKDMYLKSSIAGVKGWRNEKYAVWVDRTPYILLERAMAGVMGIITYGIHINGYVQENDNDELKIWVPRRSATKQTWPLMLDNIIAGGLGYPCSIEETVIKESIEEANLEEKIIRENIRPAGMVSYLYYPNDVTTDTFEDERSFIVGEIEYVYDLKVSADVIPRPNDGEVESFSLMDLQDVITALQNKEFKPNCALVMVEFLVRHGYITTENEPHYGELINRMHRTLPFPTLN